MRHRSLSELEGIPERYLTESWRKLRDEVLADANWRCVECGNPAQQAHHVTYRFGFLCAKKYLRALCRSCHKKKHPPRFKSNAELNRHKERARMPQERV